MIKTHQVGGLHSVLGYLDCERSEEAIDFTIMNFKLFFVHCVMNLHE